MTARIALLALIAPACGREYGGPTPSADAPSAYGRVVGLLGGGLGDVEVCTDGLPCVITEGDGDFLLEPLPVDADIVVTMTRENHLATAFQHDTALDQAWRKTLMPTSIVNSMTSRVGVEAQPGLGHVLFILWSGPDYDAFERVEGVSFEVPSAPDAATFYQGPGGLPDVELTATSSSGSGGAFNLQPGQHTLTFDGGCEPWFSHRFEPGAPVPVTVLPDFASYVDLVCR